MHKAQFERITSAIEFTLRQLADGPRPRGEEEALSTYENRSVNWYRTKTKFVLYAIELVRPYDFARAHRYFDKLTEIRRSI